MSSVSEEQKSQIISLLNEGGHDRDDIAARVGVSPRTVSAVKAHITMGTYDGSVSPTAAGTSADEADELIDAAETTFGLERDLQDALRANIEQLEGDLTVTDGGTEQTTEAGRTDIVAEDKDGSPVIIELKAGTARPKALTQLLAYMAAIGEEENHGVRGLLVAADFHDRILHAAGAVPNVRLYRYSFEFSFAAVE